jgi:hypothetical protein
MSVTVSVNSGIARDTRWQCGISATVSEASTNVAGNYSTLNYSMSATYNTSYGFTGTTRPNAGYMDLVVDNVVRATITVPLKSGSSNGTALSSGSGSFTVGHNGDGSKSVDVYIRMRTGTDQRNWNIVWNAAQSGTSTLGLTTIARASQPSLSAVSIECNGSNKFTIYTNRKFSGFTHTISYSFGSASGTIATGVTDSTTWTPAKSLLSQIPNAMSGSGTITCVTYNGSTNIGTKTVGFTLTVGSSSKPTLSGLTVTECNDKVSAKGTSITMALLSTKALSVTAASKDGASIKSVTCTNGGQSKTLTESSGKYTGSISSLTSGGYVFTVTDSRGQSTSATVSQPFYNYKYPTIGIATLTRTSETSSNGSCVASGTYANTLSNTVTISLTRSGLSAVTPSSTIKDGSWNFTQSYTDLYYTRSYTAVIKVTDSFEQSASVTVNLGAGVPTLWLGKDDIQVNGYAFKNLSKSYPMGTAYGKAGWYKLGRIHTDDSENVIFTVYSGDGNSYIKIMIKDRWQSTRSATSAYRCTVELSNAPNATAKILATSDADATVWVYLPWAYWTGFYTVDHDPNAVFYHETDFSEITPTGGTDEQVVGAMITAYPIGAIYMSMYSTSPASLFGGSWEQIKDRFLLGAGDSYSAGATGGEATHTLSVAEMPYHSHKIPGQTIGWVASGGEIASSITGNFQRAGGGMPDQQTKYSGDGSAHNNMPPYLVVYAWKRTA